ncbi:Blue-light-activated histidine kinase 1 [Rhodobacteraceae bacterium THAF1]|uniref:PAS domain-containing protein n=1 Tax=Palleronia sp. THAF1 TaxID=2587842 RepID=UPI000F4125F9|nr:PAS domain-containing protein [Palleronia sp. THAF1]QFU08688.1 Blue-light-activated histidine kinase 1 [Palleronia sp. THAF1]VDC28435.1 Blue-light-activated histidine kinase 1 [Rhodobacteraceae bacterium THAF1]
MDGSQHISFEAPREGTLLALLNQSQDCIKILSPNGTLGFMSETGQKIMEIDSFDQVMGEPWWALWPEDSQVLISDAVTRAIDGESSRFEAFCPTAKGTPRWWEVAVSPIRDESGQITHIMSISRDVTMTRAEQLADQARAVAAEHTAQVQTMIAHESRHRLKNLLTVVSSLTTLVSRHANSVSEFQSRLRAHLNHMARAQDLLIGTNRRSATLRETVTAVLEADGRLRIADIPRVSISDQAVQLLALALGELQTNAIKHGALSVDTGSVILKTKEKDGAIHVTWVEDCGEERPEPELTKGSGVELIRRMMSMQSDGVQFTWTGKGLRVSFALPAV